MWEYRVMANKREIGKIVRQSRKGRVHANLDHAKLKLTGSFQSELVRALRAEGFEYAESHSRCSVAYGGETYLEKNGIGINIVTSSLFGTFTIVN
jgi:hypothetical protein